MFSLEREQLQWLICIISLWNCYFNVFVRKYYFFTFEICLVVFLDLIDIYTDTKIGAFIAKLQAHSVFRAAILNFFSGKPRATIWFPPFLDSAYSKTPRRKFLRFYPEVHAKFTYPPHYFRIGNSRTTWKPTQTGLMTLANKMKANLQRNKVKKKTS